MCERVRSGGRASVKLDYNDKNDIELRKEE